MEQPFQRGNIVARQPFNSLATASKSIGITPCVSAAIVPVALANLGLQDVGRPLAYYQ